MQVKVDIKEFLEKITPVYKEDYKLRCEFNKKELKRIESVKEDNKLIEIKAKEKLAYLLENNLLDTVLGSVSKGWFYKEWKVNTFKLAELNKELYPLQIAWLTKQNGRNYVYTSPPEDSIILYEKTKPSSKRGCWHEVIGYYRGEHPVNVNMLAENNCYLKTVYDKVVMLDKEGFEEVYLDEEEYFMKDLCLEWLL